MNHEEFRGKRFRIWPFIRWGVPAAILLFFMIMTQVGDMGEFVKFFLFDVIALNILGIIFLVAGIFTITFGSYMIISKKAVDPKGLIFPMLLLTTVFLGLGYGLAYNAIDDFADVGNYLIGNINEEDVVIKEYRVETATDGFLYYYTFEDGRTFIEGYNVKGSSNVVEGESYHIRYLPRTKKLLSITSLQ